LPVPFRDSPLAYLDDRKMLNIRPSPMTKAMVNPA
jgi:hypothetical protein